MENELYGYMNIREECRLDKTIFKKMFYENAVMNSSDKETFKNNIDKITLKYSLKEEALNIPKFNDEELNYDEIEIIEVNLIDDSKYSKVCEIIQKTIPYPIVLVLTFNEKILINTAYKRINKNASEKNTVEKHVYSRWIDLDYMNDNEQEFMKSIDINRLSFSDMYKLYDSFVQKIDILNLSEISGDFNKLEQWDIEEIEKLQNQIINIDMQLDKFNTGIKNEEQFNKRLDMNIKIKKLELKRTKLIDKLNSN
jgi:ribosomal protein S10